MSANKAVIVGWMPLIRRKDGSEFFAFPQIVYPTLRESSGQVIELRKHGLSAVSKRVWVEQA